MIVHSDKEFSGVYVQEKSFKKLMEEMIANDLNKVKHAYDYEDSYIELAKSTLKKFEGFQKLTPKPSNLNRAIERIKDIIDPRRTMPKPAPTKEKPNNQTKTTNKKKTSQNSNKSSTTKKSKLDSLIDWFLFNIVMSPIGLFIVIVILLGIGWTACD